MWRVHARARAGLGSARSIEPRRPIPRQVCVGNRASGSPQFGLPATGSPEHGATMIRSSGVPIGTCAGFATRSPASFQTSSRVSRGSVGSISMHSFADSTSNSLPAADSAKGLTQPGEYLWHRRVLPSSPGGISVHSPFEGVDRRLCSSSASCRLMADFAGGRLCTEAVQPIATSTTVAATAPRSPHGTSRVSHARWCEKCALAALHAKGPTNVLTIASTASRGKARCRGRGAPHSAERGSHCDLIASGVILLP